MSRSRPGFTLIELLVAIAIISVLIGLLLPAVQKVREAAARMSCGNNLKQMGIAIHSYHDVQGAFPKSDPASPSNGWSWIARLLPYIEQDNLYRQLNFNLPITDTTGTNNSALIQVPIKTLLCPSDPTPGVRSDLAGWWAWPAAATSSGANKGGPAGVTCYNGYMGPDTFDPTSASAIDGVFERTLPTTISVKFNNVLDGLSNTLIVGERSPSYSPWAAWSAGNGTWVSDAYSINLIRKTVPLPSNTEAGGTKYGAISLHSGGMQGLFGDGSIHFLRENMTFSVYQQLARPADGGPLGDWDQ